MGEAEQAVIDAVESKETEERETLLEAVLQLKATGEAQVEQLRQQLRYTRIGMYCIGGLLAVMVIAALVLLPPAGRAVAQAEIAITQAQQTIAQLQPAVESLARVDFEGTLSNIDGLITESREGLAQGLAQLEQAQAKIEAFDVQTLNNAIKELDKVVRPLAGLFGK